MNATHRINPAALALATAFAVALREGRNIRSVKDLCCDAGCNAFAARGGLCLRCDAEVNAHFAETIEAHSMSTDDDGARFGFGDKMTDG